MRTLVGIFALHLMACGDANADGLCSGSCGFSFFASPKQYSLNENSLAARNDYKIRFNSDLRSDALSSLASCANVLGALQKATPRVEALFGIGGIFFGSGDCDEQGPVYAIHSTGDLFDIVVPFKSNWSASYVSNSPGVPQALAVAIQNDLGKAPLRAYRVRLEGDVAARWTSEFRKDLLLSVVFSVNVQAKPGGETDKSYSSITSQIGVPAKVTIRCLTYDALWDVYYPWLRSLSIEQGWGDVRPDKERCDVQR